MLVRTIRALAFLTALSLVFLLFDGSLFSWHPTLMAAGSVGLMTEGVLTAVSFRDQEGITRVASIWRHLAWQGGAAALMAGGFAAIYQNKVNGGKQHYQSAHARFGLATLLLLAAAVLGGAASFRRLGMLTRLPERTQPVLKAAHRNLGLLVWLLGLVTVELALGHHAVWKVSVASLACALVAVWRRVSPQQTLLADL